MRVGDKVRFNERLQEVPTSPKGVFVVTSKAQPLDTHEDIWCMWWISNVETGKVYRQPARDLMVIKTTNMCNSIYDQLEVTLNDSLSV